MRVWGQWIEGEEIYSVRMDKDWLYSFNHWSREEWHGPNKELVGYDQMKFYIQLIF